MEIRKLGEEFENLCDELLRAMGYTTTKNWRPIESWPQAADILALSNDERLSIDTKVVPANPPTLSELRDNVARSKALLSLVDQAGSHAVMLSCNVEPEHRGWAENNFAIKVWDRTHLVRELGRLAPEHTELTNRFVAFFRDLAGVEYVSDLARNFAVDAAQPHRLEAETGRIKLTGGEATFGTVGDPAREGRRLRKRLAGLRPGLDDAKAYEALVQEIVFYLFGDYLVDPRPQSRTQDGLDILDIVYRVRAGHPFWDTLTRDFRTRAIIFECKNYKEGITPAQIYSTERYVNVGALRSVCFLLSRKEPHEHAELAASGAMREGGKLFVLLHDKHLEQMLDIRQTQLRREAETGASDRDFANDPSEVLDQVIYDFLTRVSR
ncbi:hypothetical protein EJ074_11845 [Mesorhizobium sp. M3A.F.Ca.ET.080.04.2.1]|uniref:hypothetical protein n=1 Tax=Mesorhizobium sp. M3A.F.Ca.ET.080.04.2.1 TaxID=2493676 RepID=UPI000F74CC9F|nr:hypothetical protein [Mesorhizobium sp. M3A.F.Ca.ET.080.04.2.1]AZO09717.1 hypothetical protein EJ074_11845 [Mesorhizobium sp. M3A.F.Ca.ET.080.04.2.1]RWF24306.1 MAG: hypothetical protein EOS64_08225 [Mesorhizobium sp.]TGT57721.1 hypothetical protein EN813_037500 [Mesorhizobium sp. M00.F.Ca.ET.170.01.1.1]